LHYDGEAWTEMEQGSGMTLEAIHGISPTDVYVASNADDERGQVLHYDGNTWANIGPEDTDYRFMFVWAASATEVYAGGRTAGVYRYDGTAWEKLTSEGFDDLWGVVRRGP
jgi:hypothetical protein